MTPEKQQVFVDITQNVISLMGVSFILGSLFTILVMMLLDFMKGRKAEKKS
jgi:hypothetical protein